MKGYAQDQSDVISKWARYSSAPNSLYNYLAELATHQLDKREAEISNLYSLTDWGRRQKEVKRKLLDVVGPFPERTPLNAKIVSRIKKNDYTIENIIFESQPGFYVTSSLFIPDGLKRKGPAILNVIGHSAASYRRDIYQHEILNLVKKGFIVFAIDPVSQGERVQYFDRDSGKSVIGGSTAEHSYAGFQTFITGSSQAMYEIWDGIRAVDYLLSRDEVDPQRIGVTGLSGGGTLSAYLGAFDDRIYAAAPSNYITNYKRLIQSIGPQDGEQNFYRGIANGLDHADLLEVRAPKPTLMITTTRDFFSIQGAKETELEVKRVFEAYQKGANFLAVEDDDGHDFTKKNNEAMYAFFQKHLENPGDSTDLDIQPLAVSELQVTKTGQISTSIDLAETIFSLNLKEVNKRTQALRSARNDDSNDVGDIVRKAEKMSGYQKPEMYNKPVFTGRFRKKNYSVEKYFVRGDGSYVIPYLLFVPDEPNGKAIICLYPDGKKAVNTNGDAEDFVQQGFTLLIPDLLGIGELGEGKFKGDSYIGKTSFGIWFLSVLNGRSIVGLQSSDVSRLVDVLQKEDNINEIYGEALGQACTPMLYAAAFNKNIQKVCLIDPLISYRSVVSKQFYSPQYVFGAVAGSMKAYDLPDLAATIAPRKLIIIDPKDGQGKTVSDDALDLEDLSVIENGFIKVGAPGKVHVMQEVDLKKLVDFFIH